MEIRRADPDAEIDDAVSIRREVFIDEQGVPEDRERDGKDDEATHFVAYDGDEPIGTARIRPYRGDSGGEKTAKVERVAVRAERRGEAIGRGLMKAVEDAAATDGYEEVVLYAQDPVVGFYRRLGYETRGEAFEDAEILHREMRKRL